MGRESITTEELKEAIQSGGPFLKDVLKKIVMDPLLNQSIVKQLQIMGGRSGDAGELFDEALLSLVRSGKKDTLPEGKKLIDLLGEEVRIIWCTRLSQQQGLRSGVLEMIANDSLLKNRVMAKMRKLACKNDEGQDYYNQAFIKLNEVLEKAKYRGGDVRGLFLRISEHLRLNDLRKIREVNPEILPEKGDQKVFERMEWEEKREKMKEWLQKIGERCRKTLQMWNDGFSMKEIAAAIPYKDHLEAAVAKHRCLKKIYNLIDYRSWK